MRYVVISPGYGPTSNHLGWHVAYGNTVWASPSWLRDLLSKRRIASGASDSSLFEGAEPGGRSRRKAFTRNHDPG